MTTLSRFNTDPSFEARYSNRTGFSINDPDRRIPIQGHDLAQVLGGKTPTRIGRADQLLAFRDGKDGKDRFRALPWLTPLAGLLGWPERAQAHDHHPPLVRMPEFSVEPGQTPWLADLWTQLAQVDVTQPLFGLTLGGTLLMTQAVGIRQRHLMLKVQTSDIEQPQPDLFPETLPSEEEKIEPPEPAFFWDSDSATRQGKVRDENQDAVLVLRFNDGGVVLIVCDGAGGVEGGREASQSAVEAIGAELQRIWEETCSLSPEALAQAIATARSEAHEKQLDGVTTALVVLLQQDEMSFATLGDGAVAVIWPDGMVGQVQVPHHTAGLPSNIINAFIGRDCAAPPRTGTLRLEPGCLVLAMSDGASDLFPFDEFALDLDPALEIDGLAGRLLTELEDARDPDSGAFLHTDNLTLALAQLHNGGDGDQAC